MPEGKSAADAAVVPLRTRPPGDVPVVLRAGSGEDRVLAEARVLAPRFPVWVARVPGLRFDEGHELRFVGPLLPAASPESVGVRVGDETLLTGVAIASGLALRPSDRELHRFVARRGAALDFEALPERGVLELVLEHPTRAPRRAPLAVWTRQEAPLPRPHPGLPSRIEAGAGGPRVVRLEKH